MYNPGVLWKDFSTRTRAVVSFYAGTTTAIWGLISAPVCLSLLSDKVFSQKLAFPEAVRFAEDEARFHLF